MRVSSEATLDSLKTLTSVVVCTPRSATSMRFGYGADGSSHRPLGLVVIGGLIVSQFVTLFVTPAIYLYLEKFQEKVLDRFSFFRSTRKHFPFQPGALLMHYR